MNHTVSRFVCRLRFYLSIWLVLPVLVQGGELEELRSRAWSGNAKGQVALARRYQHGDGVPKSHQTAGRWAMKGVAQGDREAMLLVGELILEEKRIKGRFKQFGRHPLPISALDPLLEQQDPEAMRIKGQYLLYWFQQYGATDQAEGRELLLKAGRAGNLKAQELYVRDQMDTALPAEQQRWVLEACKRKESWAYFPQGLLLLEQYGANAAGLPQALPWMKKGAMQGDPRAQDWVAKAYFSGEGLPRDIKKAYAWARMSNAQGHRLENLTASRCARDMSEKDLAEAQALWAQLALTLKEGNSP